MKSNGGKPLFIPLMTEYFEAFASGRKRFEYRVHGPRWNEKTCTVGRKAIIAKGYGWPRLQARVLQTSIIRPKYAPAEALRLFGNKTLIRIHLTDIKTIHREES